MIYTPRVKFNAENKALVLDQGHRILIRRWQDPVWPEQCEYTFSIDEKRRCPNPSYRYAAQALRAAKQAIASGYFKDWSIWQ